MKTSDPHVLIVVESRHGATREIADSLARRLVTEGVGVVVSSPDDVDDIGHADAVVIGSAVYLGKWLKPAVAFVDRNEAALATRPVWLFSSGPLEENPSGDDGLQDGFVAELTARTNARAHHVFAGRLDRALLGPIESVVAMAVHAPSGDYRDWADVDGWAAAIAAAVAPTHSP